MTEFNLLITDLGRGVSLSTCHSFERIIAFAAFALPYIEIFFLKKFTGGRILSISSSINTSSCYLFT